MQQLSLLEKPQSREKTEVDKGTIVKLGRRSIRVYTKRRNREAVKKLKGILSQLEGKDILVSQYCDFWWYQNLRLKRLQVEWFHDNNGFVLWGTRGAQVRVLWLKFLYHVREQYHTSGRPYYLLDFWNGFRSEPIDRYYRGGYQCLEIRPAR